MIWKFSRVYNPERQLADHARPVRYELPIPPARVNGGGRQALYLHNRRPAHVHPAGEAAGQLE
jgi:hypothetical protein